MNICPIRSTVPSGPVSSVNFISNSIKFENNKLLAPCFLNKWTHQLIHFRPRRKITLMYGDVRIQVSKDVSQFFLRHDAELEHRIMVCLEVEEAATLICENNHSIVYLKEMFWPFVQVGDLQWDLALPCKAHRWPEMESEGMVTIPVPEDA